MKMINNIAVIGAGASGISAAISAARNGSAVDLYEHTDAAGSKILITGNGKCNFTNLNINSNCFHSRSDSNGRIRNIIGSFGYEDVKKFFESIGIPGKERKGRIYPYTDTADSVRTALILELKKLDVKMLYGCGRIKLIPLLKGGIKVISESFPEGRIYRNVIIACGGSAAHKTGSDGSGYEILKELGIDITDIYPALTPVILKEDLRELKGIRCEAALTLIDEKGNVTERSEGELQPFENGLSGICALDISGNACRMTGAGERAFVTVDFFPGCSDEEFIDMIRGRRESFKERNLNEQLNGLFPKKLIRYLIHPIDTRRDSFESELIQRVKHLRYEVSGDILKDMSRAQTTAGGVALYEIDDNCMLKKQKGIYVTGELLDADGICGGYNLHFAWATGYLAGYHASL
ncbi:MAG: aminoacetone oxidase family FAD-binding enzyme [Lachnospiraceae bacterium]|nr:aminoacetone oxidase family FAD-binding enzyme [Lachnospiraceae bacterium]